MKVLVTGAGGQLGTDVLKRLKEEKIECLGIDKNDFNIIDQYRTNEFISRYKPDAVVHCAGYTAVDRAEEERELCYEVNVLGTRNVASACKEIDAKLLYISTDYVFDGRGSEPYETNRVPNPINYYGITKYQGEIEIENMMDKFFILRISWLFGMNGDNFVKKIIRLSEEKDVINIVSDQFGSPTYTYDLAKLISKIILSDKYGIYHASNEGFCDWFDIGVEIIKLIGKSVKVNPITSERYLTKAKRPKNSRLSKTSLDKSGFDRLPEWKDALRRYLVELGAIGSSL
ncbi:MAG: dTDP-4-dehydrorhamnose reductase [Clostridia bacterium]